MAGRLRGMGGGERLLRAVYVGMPRFGIQGSELPRPTGRPTLGDKNGLGFRVRDSLSPDLRNPASCIFIYTT